MAFYTAVLGARVEELDDAWAAYSPASGETHLINLESAVLLEWLMAHGQADSATAAEGLAGEVGVSAQDLLPRLDMGWMPLLMAGLIRQVEDDRHPGVP